MLPCSSQLKPVDTALDRGDILLVCAAYRSVLLSPVTNSSGVDLSLRELRFPKRFTPISRWERKRIRREIERHSRTVWTGYGLRAVKAGRSNHRHTAPPFTSRDRREQTYQEQQALLTDPWVASAGEDGCVTSEAEHRERDQRVG